MELLKELSEASGVSGNEKAVREVILKHIGDHVDEHRVDAMGNLIAIQKARGGGSAKRAMIAAHMDEVGLMIVYIEKNGMLRFRPVGGIDPRVLPAKVVRIGADGVPGVIGMKAIHLQEPDERKQVVKVDAMCIDIGANSQEEAGRLVKLGDYAVFDTAFAPVSADTVKGKAFDDRAGCAVLVKVLQAGPYDCELHAAFTVQEETGLRGARVAAYGIEPDLAFVLEGTICDDGPKKRDVTPVTRLGAGPAITIADRSVITDRGLTDLLMQTAREHHIPYQIKAPGLGGTDAGAIHQTREGVPSAVLAVPARYIHGPVCMLNLDDYRHTANLMIETLKRI
jgi:endoglucanase